MTYYAGDTITDTTIVLDEDGNPSALDSLIVFSSRNAYSPPPEFIAIPVTIQPGPAPGHYVASFDTIVGVHGTYSIELISSETGVRYTQSYPVASAPQYTGEAGISMGEFRAQVADLMNDHLQITATADGGTGTWSDEDNLTDSENRFIGSHLVVASATNQPNVGQMRRIEASSSITHSLTFSDLPMEVREGDVGDIYNISGNGFRPQFYDRQIKAAVRLSYPDALLGISVEGGSTYDATAGTIDIPDVFVAVHALRYADGDYLRDVRPAGRRHGEYGSGWHLDRPARQLRVDGGWAEEMDGLNYTIFGYARHAIPDTDADILSLDVTWLLYQTASTLANTRLVDARWNNWAVEWGRLAAQNRGNIWTPRAPNTVML